MTLSRSSEEARPAGLGLDEPAAVVVQGDRFQVIGRSVVGIYDGKDHDGKKYYFLAPGEQFDLPKRTAGDRGYPRTSPRAATGPAAPRPARAIHREEGGRRVHQGTCRRRVGDGAEDLGMGRGRLSGEPVGGAAGRKPGGGGVPGRAGRGGHSHGVYRHHRIGQAGDRDPGRIRRVAGALAAGSAGPPGPARHDRRARLRPPPLRHGLGNGLPGPGRTGQGRHDQGYAAVLRLPRRGRRQRQGVHGASTPLR